jgi:hypothetical protein
MMMMSILALCLIVSMAKPNWKGKKRMLIYLRKSAGEGGDTREQLKRMTPKLKELIKEGKIQDIDFDKIVGRDINMKRKFNAAKDLKLKGDILNEGNGQSGFKFTERPVLVEGISRLPDYDGMIVESTNRLARDFAGLSHLMLPQWRENGKVIYSLIDGQQLDENRTNEAIINSQMTWGGISKQEEIAKGKEALKGKIASGYLAGSTPEWFGGKTSGGRGIDYRKLWRLGQIAGLNAKGNLDNSTEIGRIFKKDNKWANLWYQRMLGYDEAGVLEEWLDNVEAVNRFILENGGEYPKRFFNQRPVKNILAKTRGYFGYPAGVNLFKTMDFITFTNPSQMGLDYLASDKPLPFDYVQKQRIPPKRIDRLLKVQTQPKARAKL